MGVEEKNHNFGHKTNSTYKSIYSYTKIFNDSYRYTIT